MKSGALFPASYPIAVTGPLMFPGGIPNLNFDGVYGAVNYLRD